MYIYIYIIHIYVSCIYSSYHSLFCVIFVLTRLNRNTFHTGAILYFTVLPMFNWRPLKSAKPPQLMMLLPCVGYILLCVQDELEIPNKGAILFSSFTAENISSDLDCVRRRSKTETPRICARRYYAGWVPL